MNKYRRLFVILGVSLFTVVTFVVLGASYLDYVVTASYHPNTIEGLYGLKYFWIFGLAIFLNWLYVMYVAIRGVDETKLRKIGISVVIFLLIIAGAFVARFIPTNYHVEYYIGQDKYSIPWQYNPTEITHNPTGREYFIIFVSYPDFSGEYSSAYASQSDLSLSKNIFYEKEKIGISLDDICNEDICVSVPYGEYLYFTDSGFIYSIHGYGQEDHVVFRNRSELDAFKKSVVDVFNSFKVK